MQTENFTALLHQLESFWLKSRAPILEKLNPGVNHSDKSIKFFSGVFPEDFWDLYRWKNGVNPSPLDTVGNLSMFQFGIFLSLERASEIQRHMVDQELGWDRMKFPLFESGGAEYFLIECDESKDSYGMILYYSIKDIEFNRTISQFDSLYSLFLTIYECSTSGFFQYVNNSFEDEYDSYFEVARRLNPRSQFWLLYDSK